MFEAKTVFIIGAGASWHYGYPTGEQLVSQVFRKAKTTEAYFEKMREEPTRPSAIPNFIARHQAHLPWGNPGQMDTLWKNAIAECSDLWGRLQAVSPLVIDYFLGHNSHLADIGKLCIAWTILEREHINLTSGGNPNRQQIPRADLSQTKRTNGVGF